MREGKNRLLDLGFQVFKAALDPGVNLATTPSVISHHSNVVEFSEKFSPSLASPIGGISMLFFAIIEYDNEPVASRNTSVYTAGRGVGVSVYN